MHSLNHAVLGHAVAAERAGRPHGRAVNARGALSARPIPRSAAASPTRPAAWRAAWTPRWPAAPSSEPRSAGSHRDARRVPSSAVRDASASKTASRSSPPTAPSIRELAGHPERQRRSTSRSPRRRSRPAARPSSTSTAPPRRSTTSRRRAGRMRLGDEEADVRAGDTVVIAPGTARTSSATPARSRSCCSAAARPPYSDEDTVLL